MRRLIVGLFVLLFLSSCNQELCEPMEEKSSSEALMISERTMEDDSLLLAQLGYEILKIADCGEYYLVNDIRRFSKLDIAEYCAKNPETKLFRAFTVSPEVQRIFLNYESFGETDWEEEERLQYAIDQWNSLEGSNIYFATRENTSVNPSDWVQTSFVSYGSTSVNDMNSMLEVETQIGSGMPSTFAYLDRTHQSWLNASDEQKKYVYMHMLGLIVGLSDTGTYLPGTSYYDNQSIMRSHTGLMNNPNDYWNGFSTSDRYDIPLYFPLCPDELVYTLNGSASNSNYINPGENTLTVSPDYDIPVGNSSDDNLIYSIEVYNKTKNRNVKEVQNSKTIVADYEENCRYKITIRVKNNHNSELLKEFTKEYQCVSSLLQLKPIQYSSISLNENYLLEFTSNTGNCDIEFSAHEMLFDDEGDDNITIEKISNNKLRFRLLDYGSYNIKVWPSGQEERVGNVKIQKYYRPDYEVSDIEWLEDLAYTAYSDVAQCDTTLLIPPKNTPNSKVKDSLYVYIGDAPLLQERFYAKTYLKYIHNTYSVGEVMKICHYLYRVASGDISIDKGENSIYRLPDIVDFSRRIGNVENHFIGYHAVVIPPDDINFEPYSLD